MAKLEIDKLLKKLDEWAAKQPRDQVRLVKGKAMTDAQIDKIPALPKQFPFPLPTPYDPKRFAIPIGYRALLKRCAGLRLEVCVEEDGEFEPWGPFNIFRPSSCKTAHQGAGPTLCDSWSTQGTMVDDREITTTELISFATMGYSTEASRWCFYLGGKKGPPAIYEESNDYECLAGATSTTGRRSATPTNRCSRRSRRGSRRRSRSSRKAPSISTIRRPWPKRSSRALSRCGHDRSDHRARLVGCVLRALAFVLTPTREMILDHEALGARTRELATRHIDLGLALVVRELGPQFLVERRG